MVMLEENELSRTIGKRSLLILGAALPQVSLIKRAKKIGCHVICISMPGNYPGFELADAVYYVDTCNKKDVLEIAAKEKADGILTTGTDVAVRTVGYVCEKMGFNGPSYDSAVMATDKFLMKEAFVRGGVNTAEFIKASSAEEAEAGAVEIGFPVMVKCVDKSGSRGITKVENVDGIERAFNDAISFSNASYVVVEKHIEGVEIGLDGYIGGEGGRENSFLIPYNREYYNNELTNIPRIQSLPFAFPDCIADKAKEQALLAAHSLNTTKGFINMDLIVSGSDVYVIEMGIRAGGAMIPEMIESYFGIDYFGQMVRNAFGEDVGFNITRMRPSIGEIFLSAKSGIVESLSIDAKGINSIEHLAFSVKKGDHVKAFMNGPDTYGGAVVSGDSMEQAHETMNMLKSRINLVLQEEPQKI
jgi:biotin carboxylase